MTARKKRPPVLVAIVGGSGSGKTWLAEKLELALAPDAVRFSLDDFYLDRSHLRLARRAQLNFDHPRAIDWPCLEAVLHLLLAGRPAALPCYNFETHSRLGCTRLLQPKAFILLDGLWLLRRPAVRRLINFGVFLDCPRGTRLRRRLARDLLSRGRTRNSILRQFRTTVQPMHARYVASQASLADLVLGRTCRPTDVLKIAERLRLLKLTRWRNRLAADWSHWKRTQNPSHTRPRTTTKKTARR